MVFDLQGQAHPKREQKTPHLLWQVSPSFSWQQISPGCVGSSMIHPKNKWDLTNGTLGKLLELLDTQVQ